MKNKRLNNRGMTLIEIVIVVVILAGLMTILGGQVMKQFGKAKVNQAKIQMGELGKALDMFYTDCGSYPSSLNGLLTSDGADCSNWGPDAYTKKNLLKDPWNSEFLYYSDGSSYSITSLGADRREGGDGLDKDISTDEE